LPAHPEQKRRALTGESNSKIPSAETDPGVGTTSSWKKPAFCND
jgi:hypothetical protein